MIPALSLFVPSALDLAGWAGSAFASLIMIGLGRLLGGRSAPAESALIAGWGVAVLVLTAWGIATTASLRVPAAALALIGLSGLAMPRFRLGGAEWQAIGRILVLAAPILVIMASARPSLPDTWLNLLPNAAYLYDHGFFPADARPPAHSFIAGAPYGMQLASFIASLVTPGFPASAMIDFNIVLLLAAALWLARLAAGGDGAAPGWSAAALGILLATVLNPGFGPRFHLSAYSETSVTVCVAFAAWHAARAIDRMSSGRAARLDLLLLASMLAVLVNIKQESVSLVVAIVVAAIALAFVARAPRAAATRAFAVVAVPALLLYLGWRWYVLTHFALGELKPLPFAAWHWREIALILRNMLREATEKVAFFGTLVIVMGIGLRRLGRRELDLTTRLAALLTGTAILYNAALLFAYIAHFEGEMGVSAHSYFRYNTHLGLLLMGCIVLLLRGWSWSRFGGRWRRAVPGAVVLLALVIPLPFLRMLRFDLETPNLRAYQLAQEASARIAPDERLALILPGDNGTLPPTIEGVLRYLPPRRANVDLAVAPDPAAALALPGYSRALLSCASAATPGVPPGSAALLQRAGEGWKTEAVWPYPPAPARRRWSHVLAWAPLCLGPETQP